MTVQVQLFRAIGCSGYFKNLFGSRINALISQVPNVSVKTDVKEKLKSLNMPLKPKKPLIPFFKFLVERRPLIQKEHPDWKMTQLAKQCAEDWRKVHSTIKESYQNQYQSELANYSKILMEYNNKLTDEQKETLDLFEKERKSDKKKRKLKKKLRDLGRPKRPASAFFIFARDKYKNLNMPLIQANVEFKKQWESLPQEEKEKYKNIYLEEKLKYDVALKRWENKMMKEGHVDVVRGTSKIGDPKPPKPKVLQLKRPRLKKI